MPETAYRGQTAEKNSVYAVGTAIQGWHKVVVEAGANQGSWNIYGAEMYNKVWQKRDLLSIVRAGNAKEAARKVQMAVEAIVAGAK